MNDETPPLEPLSYESPQRRPRFRMTLGWFLVLGPTAIIVFMLVAWLTGGCDYKTLRHPTLEDVR